MIRTAASKSTDTSEAIFEIFSQLRPKENPKLIIVFASIEHCTNDLVERFVKTFPDAAIFGCSSAGEICSGSIQEHSVVAISFGSSEIDAAWVDIVSLDNVEENTREACDRFSSRIGTHPSELDSCYYAGITLIDGLSQKEENLMRTLSALTSLPFVGGSAADNLQMKETRVFTNSGVFTNSALLCILRTKNGYDCLKTESFKVEQSVGLIATKVSSNGRVVEEFNNEPAVIAYAKVVGCDVSELEAHFLNHPVGLVIDGEFFVRSPQVIVGTAVHFFCSIIPQQKYELLCPTLGIVEETEAALKRKVLETGNRIAAIINFNCIIRAMQLRSVNMLEPYAELFAKIPTVGFNTYGEQLVHHMNQTATMFVLLK